MRGRRGGGDTLTSGGDDTWSIAGSPTASSAPSGPIYTRANVGEVFPDPVTPLTRDTGIWLAELGWRDAWERVGAFDHDEFDPDKIEQLGITGGYCYLNASLIRLFGERAPGLSAAAMDEQFFGTQPGIPPYEEQPGDVDLNKTERIGQTFGWALTTEDLPELIDDQIMTKRLRDERPDLSAMSDRELADRYFSLDGRATSATCSRTTSSCRTWRRCRSASSPRWRRRSAIQSLMMRLDRRPRRGRLGGAVDGDVGHGPRGRCSRPR